MSWLSNYLRCCALGMETLSIDNLAEQIALKMFSLNFNTTNWKANYNYWTSGTWKGSPPNQFSWCKPSGPSVLAGDLVWEKGQPDNAGSNESCVHFRFVLNSTGTIMTDRNCANKYIFACKSSWADAWDLCCMVGMTLMSMESAGKASCYSRIVSKFQTPTYGDFWLSGTDKGCPSTFRWCSLSKNFINPELKWKAGHPVDGLDCVYLEVRNGSVLLASANCAEKKDFLCEVRKKATFQRAMQTECAEIWDISIEEIDMLLNVSAFLSPTANISLNLKCFLKCVGVEVGMFDLGALSAIATLQQIEIFTQEEPMKMESAFVAYDTCSGKQFDDECVTAYETFKCGQEQAPDLVSQIVTNNFDNGTVLSPPIPCVPVRRSCWLTNEIPCVKDQAIADLVLSYKDPSGTVGGSTVTANKMFYLRNKNITENYNPIDAYKYCCAIGWKLYEPVSSVDDTQIYNLLGGGANAIVGDTEYLNDTHDVWCRSRQVVPSDILAESVSCFPNFYTKFQASEIQKLPSIGLISIFSE
ncbi:uncharacterized protein LOC135943123 [Cloeon dipterum]|uniref:uncharacterized protein LOC135943123 n=1 Tax=Cloeon dipterum TaxID=197152 RepID=UPI0032200657